MSALSNVLKTTVERNDQHLQNPDITLFIDFSTLIGKYENGLNFLGLLTAGTTSVSSLNGETSLNDGTRLTSFGLHFRVEIIPMQ